MPLVSMRQLLDHAAENGYGIPAFNVNNLEQVQAIMQAAEETRSPVILQASAGARKYAGEPFLRHLQLAAVEAYPDIPLVAGDDLNSQVVIIPDTFTPPLPLTSAIGWTLKDVTSAPAQPLRFGAIIVTP